MPTDSPHDTPLNPDQLIEIYKDITNNIRVTDDISFKLLGVVPLAAGIASGALTLLVKTEMLAGYSELAVAGLSAIGAFVTAGLFRWELRNIQKCNWLISRAARFERETLGLANLQFDGLAKPEHVAVNTMAEVRVSSLFTFPWGKTQAEKLVYLAAIAVWLVPFAIALSRLLVLR